MPSAKRSPGRFFSLLVFGVFALAGAWLMNAPAWAQMPPRPPAVRKPLGGFAPSKMNPPGLGHLNALEDAGDYYTAGGQRIRLLRSKNEVVVRHPVAAVSGNAAKAFDQTKAALGVTGAAGHRFGKSARLEVLRSGNKAARFNSRILSASAAVDYAYPVLVDPKSGKRMIPTDELLVGLAEGVEIADVAAEMAAAGVTMAQAKGSPRMKAYLVRLIEPKASDPLAAAQKLAASPKFRWATPNFVRELEPHLTPNDPLLGMQQALHNTGQNGALADADVDAPEAWDKNTGSQSIVIAIIDDGVDTTHPDLRIAFNPGESGGGKESNGVDDDGDGFIDDYRGWDFANNDNNPNPVGTNGHGTGCAGVAAAIGNNAKGVAGIANGCKILPVKIADDSGDFTSDEAIGAAISYAAHFADVLSNSYGGGAPSPFIDAAIDDATQHGRNGKGCPVFFASGNSASTWYQGGGRWRLSTAGLNGSVRFGFFYYRGESSGGEDAVRVDNVCLLDADGYTHKTAMFPNQDFEAAFPPPNWLLFQSLGATASWSKSSVNALHGTGGQYSACSPSLPLGGYAWLFTSAIPVTGTETLAFAASADMPDDSYFYVDVYDANFTVYYGSYGPLNSGEASVDTDTGYPASSPNAIAVGAATDRDLRSDYSQYGGKLDFLAPSNGGWNDIATLDPTGSVGWTDNEYKVNFGGTSSACPLAAGVAALMLSMDPSLTRDQVLSIMRNTCDKIGGVTYTRGTNPFYGYGRINAANALAALNVPTVVVSPTGTATRNSPIRFTLSFSEAVTGLTTDGISVTNGIKGQLSGGGAQYELLVTPSGQGAVTCQVNAGAALTASQHINAASNIATVTYDTVEPVVLSVNFASNNSRSTSRAKAGDVATLLFGVSEAVQSPAVTIAGRAASVSNVSGNFWRATYSMAADDAEGLVPFSITTTDFAGNSSAPVTTATDGSSITYDRTLPTIAIGPPSATATRAGSVSYLVTYADANFALSTLSAGNITLNRSGTATGTVAVTGTGATRTVTLSNISGDGALSISITAGTAIDSAGNATPAAGPSAAFIVDNTVPTVTLSSPSAAITAGKSVSYLVSYGDANFDTCTLSPSNIALNKTGTANAGVAISGSGSTRTVTLTGVSGDGTLGITIAAGTASDIAGNLAPASAASAAFIVDNTPPAILIGNPSLAITRTGSVSYAVGYSDPHFNASTLSLADIAIQKTGTANGIAVIGGSGANRIISITGITGNGTLGFSLSPGTANDLAGNLAPAAGPSAVFTVDNTPPKLTSVHLASDNPDASLARAGDHLTLSFTANEDIRPPVVILAGQNAAVQNILGNQWAATTTVTPGTPEGAAAFNISYSDLAGNPGGGVTAATDGSGVVVDLTPPTLTSVSFTSANGNPLYVKIGDTVTLAFLTSEPIHTPTVNIAGQNAALENGSGNHWTATLTLEAGAAQGPAAVFIHFSDLAGNEGQSVTGTSDASSVVIDNIRPKITLAPQSATVNPGERAVFTAAAESLSPVSYQWFKDNQPIQGAVYPTLELESAQEIDEGSYAVAITNVAGASRSDAVALMVNDPVKIILQPVTQRVNQNENTLFEVVATGTAPLSYQWRKDRQPISHANASSYSITNAQLQDVGVYDVIITNIVGSAPSDPAELIVYSGGPKITSQPASLTVVQESPAILRVEARGTAPFTYQWFKAGVPIPNATAAAYTLTSAKDTDAGIYAVVVSNNQGYAISDGATLEVVKSAGYVFSTLAGTPGKSGAADGSNAAARFFAPEMMATDSAGVFYVTDRNNHIIRKITPDGEVSLFAGTPGVAGAQDGPGGMAQFSSPTGLAVDQDNNLYVADSGSHLIRKITPGGVVSTVAGTPAAPGSTDGPGSMAAFRNPWGVAVDRMGAIYVADSGNHTIRKIFSNGSVATVAGSAGVPGSQDGEGDGARFNKPTGLSISDVGILYVADEGNHTIRMITPAGVVSTVAGLKGAPGNSDGPGPKARFRSPDGIAVDPTGNLFIGDSGNHTIRMITPAGTVTTIGGNGAAGSANGLGQAARFRSPHGIVVDARGGLCLADTGNHTIRQGALLALPRIEAQPEPLLVAVGQSASFHVTASGAAPLAFQWRRNGAPITGATGSSYQIPMATAGSAAGYSVTVKNSAGAVTSIAAKLAVVSLAERTLIANEGATVNLTAAATGDGLDYQWLKDGKPLPNSKVGEHAVLGASESKLTIKAANTTDTAAYTCLVQMGRQRLSGGVTHLKIYNSPPVIALAPEAALNPAIVGGSYSFLVPVDPLVQRTPTTYSAVGLPAGMKIDPATGLISGRPLVASAPGKPFRVTVTASNARGKTSVVLLLTIAPVPAYAVGEFNGLVNADASINGSYGGRLHLVSTRTGSFSGFVDLAGRITRFTGLLEIPEAGNPTGALTLPRTATSPALQFKWEIDITNGHLLGDVTGTLLTSAVGVEAWRCSPAAAPTTGIHTAALTPHVTALLPDSVYPQGDGFAIFTLHATGSLSWAGKLSDGTALAGTTTQGSAGHFPMHAMLYGNTGSIHGWNQIDSANSHVDGLLQWFKSPQSPSNATRYYKAGFPPLPVTITGGKWVRPVSGQIIFGLPARPLNAQLVFTDGALPESFTQSFTIAPTGAPRIPSNDQRVTFGAFNTGTGLFSGTFSLPSVVPGTSRSAAFSGILVPRLNRGAGFFLMPALPGGSAPSINKTPIQSGKVSIESAPSAD